MIRSLVSILIVVTAAWTARAPATSQHVRGPGDRAARPLPFFYDLYTFRGRGGSTAVVAAFAVPAGRLEQEDVEDDVRYRFDVTLVLADTALRTVSRADDSVFVSFPRPLEGDHLLYTFIEVQAEPSLTTLQRVIMTDATTPGIGQLYDSEFPIPDYSGSHLMLSDIALGVPRAPNGWKRGDVTLALLPTSQFPVSAFDVYYEVYNLPDDHLYTTEIFVEEVDAETGAPLPDVEPVRLRFHGEATPADDGTLAELRHVDARLAKGSYRLAVVVTDEVTGKSATRATLFEVRGWDDGMTMVRALPRRRMVAGG